ncbi:MAG: nuclear transport factor 2 family protein [Candidatus Acidiferrales bacterium]
MTDGLQRGRVATLMQGINQAWLRNQITGLESKIHPDIVVVFPKFSGRSQGREAFIDAFRQFCQSTTVQEFRVEEQQIDVVGCTAAINYGYRMLYERSGVQYRSSGRDLWIFQLERGEWVAVWRTMLDIQEDIV